MTQHRNLDYGQRLPEAVVDAIQQFISTQMTPNLKIQITNPTTLKIPASTDNDQVGIGINGRWRWNTADITAAHPGGAAAEYDVYVTASDNVFIPGSPETDNTVYSFGMAIRAAASPPATALYRKIATCTWNGSAIVAITPIIGLNIPEGYITTFHIKNGTILEEDLGFIVATDLDLTALSASLAAHVALTTSAHGGIVASSDFRLSDARVPTGAAGSDIGGSYPSSVTVLKASTTWAYTGVGTPSDISANQNNYNPSGLSTKNVLRLNPIAAVNITGLAGGSDGRIIVLRNVNPTFSISLTREDSNSTAANRFSSAGVIRPNSSIVVQYDSTLSRWTLWGSGGGTTPSFVGSILTFSGTQSFLSGGAEASMPWSAESKDSDGFHTGSDDHFVVPAGLDGVYTISAEMWANAHTDAWSGIRINGVLIAAGVDQGSDTPLTGGPKLVLRSDITAIDLAQGDVIDVRVKNVGGANMSVTSGRFTLMRVGT